jgi:nucleoside-diphosphate-sugar epimerase
VHQGLRVRAADIKPLDQWYQITPESENRQSDLSTLQACREVVRNVDLVYNLAANMGGMGFIATHRAECMLSVLINTHMLLAAIDAGVSRYFFASSACVYRADRQQTSDATALIEADAYPAMPEDGYGWEKLFGERMCQNFTEDFGLATRVARFHNVYGPHGSYDDGREKAPAALCRKIAQAALSGRHEIEIWGDGEQTRSFMYIDDCINGTMQLVAGESPEPINLGSSEKVTINEMVTMIERIAGITVKRSYQLDAPVGVRGRNSDNRLFRDRYGWEPSTPLMEGLEHTYQWIFDQLSQGRSSTLHTAPDYLGVRTA